jgi:hypothetical protein
MWQPTLAWRFGMWERQNTSPALWWTLSQWNIFSPYSSPLSGQLSSGYYPSVSGLAEVSRGQRHGGGGSYHHPSPSEIKISKSRENRRAAQLVSSMVADWQSHFFVFSVCYLTAKNIKKEIFVSKCRLHTTLPVTVKICSMATDNELTPAAQPVLILRMW